MKKYALKKKDSLVIEIYMPESEIIPNIDYCFHAADWALCYPINTKARAILNAAQGLALLTSPLREWKGKFAYKDYYKFEFKDEESARIFWVMVKDYL